MAKEVTMFQAFDGEVFESRGECVEHERVVEDQEKIGDFLQSKHNIYDKPAHMTVAENTLQAFCAFLRGDKPIVAEEPVDFEKGKKEKEAEASK